MGFSLVNVLDPQTQSTRPSWVFSVDWLDTAHFFFSSTSTKLADFARSGAQFPIYSRPPLSR